jgi:hypothetical protein
MAITEVLNLINKKDISKTTKDELVEVLNYYKRLQVVYINNDEQLIFL